MRTLCRGTAVVFPLAAIMALAEATPAWSACSNDGSGNLSCSGTLTTPITVYDAAAAFQPTLGSNAYTPANPAFPAASNPNNPGYNPNPPTVTLNFDNTVSFVVTNPPTAGFLADRGLVAANFSNTEDPAVNNVVINNAGTFALSTNQIATTRMAVIVADSQVNNFTVSNTGKLSVTQTFPGFSAFNTSNLSVTSSGSPATYTARYSGATLNVMSVFYSDDNTNEFTVNNTNTLQATGNYASVYYGRADTTINNSGTLANTSWTPGDSIGTGHWAIATWGGADYLTVPGSNPDSNVVVLNNGQVTVLDTSATTITNNANGVIKGDIVVVDVTPQVYAAGMASGAAFPLAVSGSNAGPRDSNIENFGLINGNFYLGSGTHVIDNAAGATINGSFNVNQRPSQASFATAIAGTAPGTYQSAGGTDFLGNACPTAGQNTTNGGCAATHNVLATFVGGQSFTLTNEGTLNGDIIINDQPTSVNTITLTGTGFSGNVVALNGAGSNSLTLIGVTNLASVQNFSSVDLQTSQVTVPGGVSLVDGSTLATTIFGPGGTSNSPSTNTGTIFGTLTLGGATTIVPSIAYIVHNGDAFQVASSVSGGTLSVDNSSALVNFTSDTSSGALVLKASVLGVGSVPGLSNAGAATLGNLLSYNGSNAQLESLGAAVESLGSLGDVRFAAEQLRPAVNGASIQVPLGVTSLFQSQLDSRLDSLLFGGTSWQQAAAGSSPAMAYAAAPPRPAVNYFKAPPPPPGPDTIFWGNLLESGVNQQAIGPVAGYSGRSSGLIAGADRRLTNNIIAGGAFGYAISSVLDDQAPSNSIGLETYQGLVYGSLIEPSWYVNGSLGLALERYTTNRRINFPGFTDAAFGNHDGDLFSARIDGGYPIRVANGFVVPVASLTYAHLYQDAYSEASSAGAALNIGSAQNDSLRSEIGAKAIVPIELSSNFTTAVSGHVEWMHEFGDVTQAVTAGFVGGGGNFLAVGPTPDRNMADLGADLKLASPSERQSLTISYSALLGSTYVQQTGMLKARFALDGGFLDPVAPAGGSPRGAPARPMSYAATPWDALVASAGSAFAQDTSTTLPEVQVIGTTPVSAPSRRVNIVRSRPVPGPRPTGAPAPIETAVIDPSLIERDKVPSNVQVVPTQDFDHAVAPNFLDALQRSLAGVSLSDQTGSAFQRDLNYRGFIASPVIGTPQGLAVYQNGVRVNEVFGDIVNWDFIPEEAVDQTTLAPSNPAYGLNALGGAITITMKNGFNFQGVQGEVSGGSYGRRTASIQAGGQYGSRYGDLSGYVAADATNDDGWRQQSPSQLRRVYADLGARGDQTEFHVTFTGASNDFGVAAATPVQMLNQDWSSIYTVPQTTHNDLAFLTASGSYKPTDTLSIDGNVYYRYFNQRHVDGNGSDAQNSGCPDATVLCFPDLNGNLTNLVTTGGQTVPATGLLGSSVLGEIDRTWTDTHSFGGTLQAASSEQIFNHDNHFIIGASVDRGLVQFSTNSELGTINADQFPFVQGVGLFIDQPSGDVAPVSLGATTLYTGIYVTDTFDVTSRLSVTAGGRYNNAQINLTDELGNDPGLNGSHTYSRFNPMVGATYKLTSNVNIYASYSEANRAPTPLELGCSDPLRPCLIDNSLVADPELKQVVSHTVEAGLRGHFDFGERTGIFSWNMGVYHTENDDDIINVASSIPGHEFFQNGGNTLRQGIEAGATYKRDRWNVYANYTLVDATFLSPLTLSSPNNPLADANGNIAVVPGDHLTGIPDYRFKAGAEYQITEAWKLGADLNVVGSQYLVGDEANQNPKVPAYWFVNLHTSYKVNKNLELFGLVQNLFNQHYFVYGTFFETDSFPYLNLTDPRTFLPGAPLTAYAGLRGTF